MSCSLPFRSSAASVNQRPQLLGLNPAKQTSIDGLADREPQLIGVGAAMQAVTDGPRDSGDRNAVVLGDIGGGQVTASEEIELASDGAGMIVTRHREVDE